MSCDPCSRGLIPHSFSTIVLFQNQAFSKGFWRLSRKKDPWNEWKWKLPLELFQFSKLDSKTRRFPKDPWNEWKWKLPLGSLFPPGPRPESSASRRSPVPRARATASPSWAARCLRRARNPRRRRRCRGEPRASAGPASHGLTGWGPGPTWRGRFWGEEKRSESPFQQ